MAQVGPAAARRTLEALARAHLVERGGAYGRWRMHDLIRLYAGERDEAEPGEQIMALVWLLFHYQSAALSAMPYLSPTAGPPADGPFRDRAQALEWLDTEYAGLTAPAHVTAALETAVRLLHAAGDRLGEGVARAGLDAARRMRGGDAPARTASP